MANPLGRDWRPPYFENLVKFMADPTDTRSIQDFAKDNDIDYTTVYQYKRRHPEILEQAVSSIRSQYIMKLADPALRAVFANINKNHLDRKLALQLAGLLIERSEVKQTISAEEKREKAKALMAKLSERLGTQSPIPMPDTIAIPIDNTADKDKKQDNI